MDSESIARVQEHYDVLRPHAHVLVQRFYDTLFARRPELRQLFPQDLSKLYVHFDATLAMVVDNLGRIGTVDAKLQDLGVRHLEWGANPEHYLAARDALLLALEHEAGSQWSSQLAADWRAAINAILVSMLRAAAVETARIAQLLAEERQLN
jgi:hemoglobin-like flavoprotein